MDKTAISFEIQRDANNQVTGFSLIANETLAECFCASFPFAAQEKKATVVLKDGKIIFMHQGREPDEGGIDPNDFYFYSQGGTFEADISPEDSNQIHDLMNLTGAYAGKKLALELRNAWGKGFEIKIAD